MKSIFILYMPGHAGNFLTRLFSLSPETIPQVPISNLISGEIPVFDNRAEYYSFEHVTDQYSNWQDFHRVWPDFYQHELFDYFNTVFPEPFSYVIYAIHPHEFLMYENIIKKRNDSYFYHVDLSADYHPWVLESQQNLNFTYRPNYAGELAKFSDLKIKYSSASIDLDNILKSPETFVVEYLKVASSMQLTPDLVSAQKLYQGWINVRGPK